MKGAPLRVLPPESQRRDYVRPTNAKSGVYGPLNIVFSGSENGNY